MGTISVDHLSFSYPTEAGQTPLILSDISATFTSGAFTLLTGPSGSGKSTLMKLISGLYPHFAGKVMAGTITIDQRLVSEIDETKRSQMVAMMFQNPNQQFAMDTVERDLIFALENQQVAPTDIMPRVDAALTYVGIEDLRHRKLNSLSGGEKQKVALAVIIAMDTDIILLDEPFASVDPDARQLLLSKLVQLNQEQHKTIIISDHDLEDYAPLIDNLYVLNATGDQLRLLTPEEQSVKLEHFKRSHTHQVALSVPDSSDEASIILHQLKLSAGERTLIDQPDFRFYRHRITLLTGPNGTGKSTLLSALSKLTTYAGSITVNQQEVSQLRSKQLFLQEGLVFQDADQQFLNVTMAEELALSMKNSQKIDYFKPKLDAFLKQLQLDQLQDQVVYSLSGGQKKKLQILEMLIMATPILLFDEPFTGLDFVSLQAIMAVMRQVATDCQQTYLIVSHQLFGLESLVDYHVTLDNQHLQYVEELA